MNELVTKCGSSDSSAGQFPVKFKLAPPVKHGLITTCRFPDQGFLLVYSTSYFVFWLTFLFFLLFKFVSFDHLHPFCPFLTPLLWQPPICSLYLWVSLFRYCFVLIFQVWERSYSICLFFCWHISLSVMPWGSSMLSQTAGIPFLWPNNIQLYLYTTTSLSIHPLMDT